jgi:aryl-alcohol dehydrogenase-like predicted oxidoreductase
MTDRIDLYQTHRWDYRTPIEQTLKTITYTIREGKTVDPSELPACGPGS